MGKDVRSEILKRLNEATEWKRNIKLPKESIRFEKTDESTLKLILSQRKYIEGYDNKNGVHVNYNMQSSCVCFEAWAVIIKTYCTKYKKIVLGVDKAEGLYEDWINRKDKKGKVKRNGHVGRFFYRALRFSQQYDWFELDEAIEVEVRKFEDEWLKNERCKLCNNIPQGKPDGEDKNDIDENYFERKLAQPGVLFEALVCEENLGFDGDEEIYRQLPVGLYEEVPASKNTVFTGGKSAIDMWTCKEKIIYPIELKYQNEMVGILTEIFFYANFLWDLVRKEGFEIGKPETAKARKAAEAPERGYAYVKEGYYTKVKAILLADSYHPLITKAVMVTMNAIAQDEGGKHISYVKCSYDPDKVIEKTRI